MKVLYIVTAYPRSPEDVITPWLTETIRRLGDRGVAVDVLAPSYRGLGDQVIEGVRVHRFRYAPAPWETLTHDQTAPDRVRERPWFLGLVPGYVAAGSLAAARLARTGRYDAVHAFWPIPHGVLGMAAKRATGIPLVSTFFGVELTWAERQLRAARPLLRRLVAASDAVTVISSHTEAVLQRLVPGARATRIPFGAAVGSWESPAPAPRTPGDPLRLLFVGRLVERKGVHVLLEALSRLPLGSPVRLDVLGDGPERERLVARAGELGLGSRATFHGFVGEEVLRERLAGCDALVLPAITDAKGDVEGLGVVLLEAMTFGKPVIASASGGIVDIVRDGANGFLVPPGDAAALADAIGRLADAPAEELERLGAAARADVEAGFSWEVIVDRLVEVYRTVSGRG